MRIVLLVAVLFSVAWFSFLRPGAVTSAQTSAKAAVEAPISAVDKAKAAAAATDKASNASDAASDAVGGSTTSSPSSSSSSATTTDGGSAPSAAAKAKTDLAAAKKSGDVGAQISAEVQAGKVVVVLFWDKSGADDRAARDAVRDLPKHGGKVATHILPISAVGSLEGLTRGVSVTQSPTTIIINEKATARTLVGLTDPTQVDQLVRAAIADK